MKESIIVVKTSKGPKYYKYDGERLFFLIVYERLVVTAKTEKNAIDLAKIHAEEFTGGSAESVKVLKVK